MKINPKIVNRIREKTINYLSQWCGLIQEGSLNMETRQEDEVVIDKKVLYYLQVGEDVLDADIKRKIKEHKNWMKNSPPKGS